LPHEQQHLWAAAAVAFRKSVGKLPMLLQTGNALLDLAAKCNLRHSPRRMLPGSSNNSGLRQDFSATILP